MWNVALRTKELSLFWNTLENSVVFSANSLAYLQKHTKPLTAIVPALNLYINSCSKRKDNIEMQAIADCLSSLDIKRRRAIRIVVKMLRNQLKLWPFSAFYEMFAIPFTKFTLFPYKIQLPFLNFVFNVFQYVHMYVNEQTNELTHNFIVNFAGWFLKYYWKIRFLLAESHLNFQNYSKLMLAKMNKNHTLIKNVFSLLNYKVT